MNTINPVGKWSSFWTEELKSALKTHQNNTQVGETLVLETSTFKVWNIHLPKGASLPFHKHSKPYFYTAITAGKSRSFYNDGSIKEIEYKANDITYFHDLSDGNCFIHNLENIGGTTLIFTTVEFKTQT
ncbi:cupin domain-containing protein [Aestuariivivens insulae]|uniref:hypothetical protein n=1 Tax=Aestuariivivens insulae TaxID=1621988 RepID=UPI001F58812E|nr:hypothetical protein [Aestuariivivens insulae]